MTISVHPQKHEQNQDYAGIDVTLLRLHRKFKSTMVAIFFRIVAVIDYL